MTTEMQKLTLEGWPDSISRTPENVEDWQNLSDSMRQYVLKNLPYYVEEYSPKSYMDVLTLAIFGG